MTLFFCVLVAQYLFFLYSVHCNTSHPINSFEIDGDLYSSSSDIDWNDVLLGITKENITNVDVQNACTQSLLSTVYYNTTIICDRSTEYPDNSVFPANADIDDTSTWVPLITASTVEIQDDITSAYITASAIDLRICLAFEKRSTQLMKIYFEFNEEYINSGSCSSTAQWRCLYPDRRTNDLRFAFDVGGNGNQRSSMTVTVEQYENSSSGSWIQLSQETATQVPSYIFCRIYLPILFSIETFCVFKNYTILHIYRDLP